MGLGQADCTDFGIGECHPRNRVVIEGGWLVTENVGDHDARLRQGDVREHREARDVAHRPDAVCRAQVPVDRDHPAGAVDACRFEPEPVEHRSAARREEQPVAGDRGAVLQRHHHGVAARCCNPVHAVAGVHDDPLGGERFGHHGARLRFLGGQETIGSLDDRDVDTEACEDLAELAPHCATAEDDERTRQLVDLDRVVGGPEGDVAQPCDRRNYRLRAGRDHDRPAGSEVPAVDGDGPGTREAPTPSHQSTAPRLESTHGGGVIPPAGGLVADPSRHGCPVGLHVDSSGHAVDAPGLLEEVGGADHHLRRDARPVRALAAEELVGDSHDVETRGRQLQRKVLAAGPNPEDHDVDRNFSIRGHG